MKMRTIKLAPKFLLDALQGKAASFVTNLPDDAQLLDLRFDLCSNQVFAVIRSDSFQDIAELYPIPELKLNCTTSIRTVSRPITSVKTETKPGITAKTQAEPVKKPQIQPTQTVSRIEQEFSPEQRRLLNFKTEGEFTIVKPNQFLKAEWNDINEVVKSLGGKWVKGDIINYWEIPPQ